LVASGFNAISHLQNALALHQQGKLGLAEASYRQLLAIDPRNADALNLLGVIAHQTGHYQSALDLISQAIGINSNFAGYYSNQGNAFKELKQLEAAVSSYDKAIKLESKNASIFFNRGNALRELKNLEASVDSYDKAVSLKPDYAEAYNNRGIALLELKQLDIAVLSFLKAIDLNPDYSEAYNNLGSALQKLKNSEDALASYDKAVSLKPDYAEAYNNRGIALQDLKQLDAAVISYEKAVALKPDYAEAFYNQGVALQGLKNLDAAVISYDKAIEHKSDYAEAYNNRGIVLQELNQFVAAIASYDKASALKPDYEYLFGIRFLARMCICDWQNFEINIQELSYKIQSKFKATTCFAALVLPICLADQRQMAETWSRGIHPFSPSLGPILKTSKKSKIRIGYYSADFHNHATSYLMAELFELHNKDSFEIFAFSFGPNLKDEMRQRVAQSFDQFIDVANISDKAIAQLSRELEIDIAIDLKGLTRDARLGIFSYKAAPIQVSYLGYPGTLGADYIDYLIADRILIPEESQNHYTEKIVYLPHSYQVNDRQKVLAPTLFTKDSLGLPQDAFVFCCFNNNFKITPGVFDVWIRILKAVDESVLWLFEDNTTVAINLRKEAQRRGIDPARLLFAKRLDLPEHLARQKLADLFLDTFPCNAHTTASDALWAGLPVLTCMGESFASRVAGSLLNAIGLPELVTETQTEYEVLAIELAKNPVKLKAIKDKLEKNRLTTPLFDTPRFTKNIETAYLKMFERYHTDLPPDNIYITDE